MLIGVMVSLHITTTHLHHPISSAASKHRIVIIQQLQISYLDPNR